MADKINENCSEFTLVLLGNKTDIDKKKWQITQKEIDEFVKQKNIKYYAISAKNNIDGVSEIFKYLANTIYNKLKLKLFEENKMNLKIENKMEEKFSSSYNDNKKIKELKDVLNNFKSEYDRLKKDYDLLKKDFDKLKDENEKLNIGINKAKNNISNPESRELITGDESGRVVIWSLKIGKPIYL